MDNNLSLFDDEHAEVGQFLDNIDSMADVEIKKIWPQTLVDFVDLFTAELKRQGETEEKAHKSAVKLVATQAHYFGGRPYYIPKGDILKTAIRDINLFQDYMKSNGKIQPLAEKYKLTDLYVYSIIRQQVALHRKRHQVDMFEIENVN